MDQLVLTPSSLILSFSLVIIAMIIAYKEKLGINKELLIAMIRMVVQLIIAGFVLTYIFKLNSKIVTVIVMLFMITNAAYNASKRSNGIPYAFRISFISILIGTTISAAILVLSGTILFTPSQLIPITGMLVGQSMNIIGLTFRNLTTLYKDRSQAVNERLALGASPKLASQEIIRETIKGSLQPTIDTVKTVGVVTLPGMMTGMMLAGAVPFDAIMYQMMVYFMITAIATITSVIATYLSYPLFFDDKSRYIGLENY